MSMRKEIFRYIIVIIIAFGIFSVKLRAKNVYVNASCGNDLWSGQSPDCIEPDGPKASIQSAIAAADPCDAVILAEGVYDLFNSIDFQGKPLTLRSIDPHNWQTINATVIRGRHNVTCIVHDDYDPGSALDTVVEGVTITNGSGLRGGGVYVVSNALILRHCIIRNNGRYENGTIMTQYGGGVCIEGYAHVLIDNCIIADNAADSDGAVRCYNFAGFQTCRIEHCTIANNVDFETVFPAVVDAEFCSVFTMINSIVWNQDEAAGLRVNDAAEVRYCCLQEVYLNSSTIPISLVGQDGNIEGAPEFVQPVYACLEKNPNPPFECISVFASDYRLKMNSPCIDRGDPSYPAIGKFDLEGQPRRMNSRVEIGADELAPRIEVTSPLENDTWAAKSTHTICWNSYGIDSLVYVFLLYDVNGNEFGLLLEEAIPDTGRRDVVLPSNIVSDQCRIFVDAHTPPPFYQLTYSGTFALTDIPPGPPADSSWPAAGGNSAHSGLSPHRAIETGRLQWQFTLPQESFQSITLGAEQRIHAACENGLLYTLDTAGNLAWSYDAGSPLITTPAIGLDGSQYFGSQDGYIHAVSHEGLCRWKWRESKRTGSGPSALPNTPVITEDGTVILSTHNAVLAAVQPDGTVIWERRLNESGRGDRTVMTSPTLGSDGAFYVGTLYDPCFYAIDVTDGSTRWRWSPDPYTYDGMELDLAFYNTPVVASDGTIYTTLLTGHCLYALDPDEGTTQWAVDVVALTDILDPCDAIVLPNTDDTIRILNEPAVGPDGIVYIASDQPFLVALHPADGRVKWITRLGMIGFYTLAVDAEGRVYAASEDGGLYVLDSDGTILSHLQTDFWLARPAIDADGRIYLSQPAGSIIALSPLISPTDSVDLHRPADLNRDNACDLQDFQVFSSQWLFESSWRIYEPLSGLYPDTDMDFSLMVDVVDMNIFTTHWLSSDQ